MKDPGIEVVIPGFALEIDPAGGGRFAFSFYGRSGRKGEGAAIPLPQVTTPPKLWA